MSRAAAYKTVKSALVKTITRLEILLDRGDLSTDPEDEHTTRGWKARVVIANKALRKLWERQS